MAACSSKKSIVDDYDDDEEGGLILQELPGSRLVIMFGGRFFEQKEG